MKNWMAILIIVLIITLVLLFMHKSRHDIDFEPGKVYEDPQTGVTIECFNPIPKGSNPIKEIFNQNNIKGTLYKQTDKYVCYKFPKVN